MKNGTIPSLPARLIVNGCSGSGKTQLLVNLLCKSEFYGADKNGHHYFDQIFLFSPTAGKLDDLCSHLLKHTPLTEDHIFNEFDQKLLTGIMNSQKKKIEKEKDISKSKKTLIMLDDIQSDQKFLKSKVLLELYLQSRHYNISMFLLGQCWTKSPRSIRLQASNIIFFPCTGSELKLLTDEFCPHNITKNEFREMFNFCCSERFQFMHINMTTPPHERFRKNLDKILELKK